MYVANIFDAGDHPVRLSSVGHNDGRIYQSILQPLEPGLKPLFNRPFAVVVEDGAGEFFAPRSHFLAYEPYLLARRFYSESVEVLFRVFKFCGPQPSPVFVKGRLCVTEVSERIPDEVQVNLFHIIGCQLIGDRGRETPDLRDTRVDEGSEDLFYIARGVFQHREAPLVAGYPFRVGVDHVILR